MSKVLNDYRAKKPANTDGTGCALVILFLIVALIGISISGLIIMLLWNWVIVSLFSASPITFWMGVGITLLLMFVGSFFKK